MKLVWALSIAFFGYMLEFADAQAQQARTAATSTATSAGAKPPAAGSSAATAAAGASPNAAGVASNGESADATKERARQAFVRGMASVDSGALEVGLTELRASVKLYPTCSARQNTGVLLHRLRRFDEAVDTIEAVLRDCPSKLSDQDTATLKALLVQAAPMLGTIEIKASESDASVVVDGVELGKAPKTVRVNAGSRFVRVYKEGFLPFEQRLEVAGRATSTVNAVLGALLQGGRLVVSDGGGATVDVVVDNAIVGKTPWQGTLALGRHTVLLRGEGDLGSMPAAVEIKLNQVEKLQLLAEPLACKLRIEPSPATAIVAIDSAEVGRGVWTGAVRCGGHLIEIADKGYLSTRKQISVAKERELTLAEKLERDPNSDEFKRANPARIFVGLAGGFLLAPSLGGPNSDSCGSDCSGGLGLGVSGTLRIGYRLGNGLGLGIDVGVMHLRGSYSARDEAIVAVGGKRLVGKADDSIRATAPFAGISVSLESGGDSLSVGGRLGAGVMRLAAQDDRQFTYNFREFNFATNQSIGDSGNKALVAYVRPDFHIGVRASKRLVVEFGAEAWILLNSAGAVWKDTNVPAGDAAYDSRKGAAAKVCPGDATDAARQDKCYLGVGSFNQDNAAGTAVLGDPLVVLSPYVGARLEF